MSRTLPLLNPNLVKIISEYVDYRAPYIDELKYINNDFNHAKRCRLVSYYRVRNTFFIPHINYDIDEDGIIEFVNGGVRLRLISFSKVFFTTYKKLIARTI